MTDYMALLICIVVMFLAALGLIGFMFWNFITKDENDKPE